MVNQTSLQKEVEQRNIVNLLNLIAIPFLQLKKLFGKMFGNRGAGNQPAVTTGPSYGIFGNPVTGTIMLIIIGFFIITPFIALIGSFWAALPLGFAFAMMWFGRKEHGVNEAGVTEIGVIKWFGRVLKWRGCDMVVDKDVFLAPYLRIETIVVNATPTTIKIPVKLESRDGVNTTGELSFSCEVSMRHPSIWVKYGNGKWDQIQKVIELQVKTKFGEFAKRATISQMNKSGKIVSDPLHAHLRQILPESVCGARIIDICLEVVTPLKIQEAQNGIKIAVLNGKARLKTMAAFHKAADAEIAMSNKHDDEPITTDVAHERVKTNTLLAEADKNYNFDELKVSGGARDLHVIVNPRGGGSNKGK